MGPPKFDKQRLGAQHSECDRCVNAYGATSAAHHAADIAFDVVQVVGHAPFEGANAVIVIAATTEPDALTHDSGHRRF